VNRMTPVARLSLGLVALTGTILLGLDMAGLMPAPAEVALESRLALSETLAAQAATAAATRDLTTLRQSLQITVERHPEMLSAGLRSPGGRLLLKVGEHRRLWSPESPRGSTASHVRIPLMRSGDPWADLELRFTEPGGSGVQAIWQRPVVPLLAAMSILGFAAYLFYLRRSLRHLDPSAVIPARVQATLDVMAEGVVVLDADERAVLVNAPFADRLGRHQEDLIGVEISSLGWRRSQAPGTSVDAPWTEALSEGKSCTGEVVRIDTPEGARTFVVNASPVRDGWGAPKGVIATFDDVTELQHKTQALEEAMVELEKSQDEIRLQNEELEVLAKRDSLTGVANRRAFMEVLERQFADAALHAKELGCVMVDIDHFKRVNDTHGHSVGDEVIRRLAETLSSEVRDSDSVCRYGGEEFCVVLPGATLEVSAAVAERMRAKIQGPGFARVPITASFGVSSMRMEPRTPAELIDQADRALYESKEAGRNQVTRWDELPPAKRS